MKIKFGAIVVAGSGKIGGHVASKNRAGAYLRTKVTPSNPSTSFQQLARSILTSLSVAWATLTDAQRASWNGAVKDFSSTDIFGDIRNPSGLNLFIKLNANLAHVGGDLLTDAPQKVEIPFSPIATAVYDLSLSTGVITFGDAALDGATVVVSGTAPLSQGVSFVKSQLRKIGTFVPVAGSVDIATEYVAKFGNPPAGANIVITVKVIAETGQAGTTVSHKMTVQA